MRTWHAHGTPTRYAENPVRQSGVRVLLLLGAVHALAPALTSGSFRRHHGKIGDSVPSSPLPTMPLLVPKDVHSRLPYCLRRRFNQRQTTLLLAVLAAAGVAFVLLQVALLVLLLGRQQQGEPVIMENGGQQVSGG